MGRAVVTAMASQHAASRRCVPGLGFTGRAAERGRQTHRFLRLLPFHDARASLGEPEPNHPGSARLPRRDGRCRPRGAPVFPQELVPRTGVPGARKAGAGAACCGPRSAPCHAVMRRARARTRAPAAPPGAPWTRATEPAGETHVRFGSAPAPRTGVTQGCHDRAGEEARQGQADADVSVGNFEKRGKGRALRREESSRRGPGSVR